MQLHLFLLSNCDNFVTKCLCLFLIIVCRTHQDEIYFILFSVLKDGVTRLDIIQSRIHCTRCGEICLSTVVSSTSKGQCNYTRTCKVYVICILVPTRITIEFRLCNTVTTECDSCNSNRSRTTEDVFGVGVEILSPVRRRTYRELSIFCFGKIEVLLKDRTCVSSDCSFVINDNNVNFIKSTTSRSSVIRSTWAVC